MATYFADNSLSIGRTPLVKLNRMRTGERDCLGKIEGKTAYSVKCRISASMIWDAEQRYHAGQRVD
jgi:cysteine synthase A